MSLIIIIATVALMIFFNALYVAAEFATVSARRTKVTQMAAGGNRTAQSLLKFMEDSQQLDRYVAACQLGITISSLVLGAYGQNVIAQALIAPIEDLLASMPSLLNLFGSNDAQSAAVISAETLSVTFVLILITTLQVIMGELFPKSVAIQYPERVAMAVVWPMRISLKLFAPLIWLFNGSATVLLRLMGYNGHASHDHAHSAEEIELLVTESHEGGLLDDNERRMLRNAFRLRDLTARHVMSHRTRLLAAPLSSTVESLLNLTVDEGYSRIPLYEKSIDDIKGFVHVKDLFTLHVNGETDPRSMMRDVIYVPETLPVVDVWEKLNARGRYIAVVFDEFGGTAGLITFEDVIEEIFGELQDEFDDEMALIARDKEGRIYLRGDLLVADVNEYLTLGLPDDGADTLSGLVFSELGRAPEEGEEVTIGATTIRVESLEDLGVQEVSLLLPPIPDDMDKPFTEWEVAEHE